MKFKISIIFVLIILIASGLTGCIEDEEKKDDPSVESVSIGAFGGDISAEGGKVTLSFPAGALDSDKEITIKAVSTFENTTDLIPGTSFVFGPTGTQFSNPVILTIGYDPASLPGTTKEGDLGIALYQNDDWVLVGSSSVDEDANTVTVTVDHFSVYGVIDSHGNDQDDDPVNIEIPDPPSFDAMDFTSNFNTFLNGGTINKAGWSGEKGNWRVFSHPFYSNQDEEPTYEYTYGANNEAYILSTAHSGAYTDFKFNVGHFDSGDRRVGIYLRADPTDVGEDGRWRNGYRVEWFYSSGYVYVSVAKVVDSEVSAFNEEYIRHPSHELAHSTATVICSGPYLYLSIGGVQLWSGMDETFSSGQVGIWAGLDRLDRNLSLNKASLYV